MPDVEFGFTGAPEAFLVPARTYELQVTLRGAGDIEGLDFDLPVLPGQTVYVLVGGQPSDGVGGWNGGGDAPWDPAYMTDPTGGFGATDLRLTLAPEDRVGVAPGRGGSAFWYGYPEDRVIFGPMPGPGDVPRSQTSPTPDLPWGAGSETTGGTPGDPVPIPDSDPPQSYYAGAGGGGWGGGASGGGTIVFIPSRPGGFKGPDGSTYVPPLGFSLDGLAVIQWTPDLGRGWNLGHIGF